MAEWSNVPHSKCGVRGSVPWVRIPPSPPLIPPLIYGSLRRRKSRRHFRALHVLRDNAGVSPTLDMARSAPLWGPSLRFEMHGWVSRAWALHCLQGNTGKSPRTAFSLPALRAPNSGPARAFVATCTQHSRFRNREFLSPEQGKVLAEQGMNFRDQRTPGIRRRSGDAARSSPAARRLT